MIHPSIRQSVRRRSLQAAIHGPVRALSLGSISMSCRTGISISILSISACYTGEGELVWRDWSDYTGRLGRESGKEIKGVYIGQRIRHNDNPSIQPPLRRVSMCINQECSEPTLSEYVPARNLPANKACNLFWSIYRSWMICCGIALETVDRDKYCEDKMDMDEVWGEPPCFLPREHSS